MKNLKTLEIEDCGLEDGGTSFGIGIRLLQFMLEGKTIENQSMILLLQGLEVAKGFIPCLRDGSRCTLQLPENWLNDYCGFLMCVIFQIKFYRRDSVGISIMKSAINGTDSQQDGDWNESCGDEFTWVGYVSFASLRHTTWWNQTHNAVSFNIEGKCYKYCGGLGVRLVDKKYTSDPTEKSTDHYAPNFKIESDSGSALSISLSLYDPAP
ncbi:hypothetical protein L1987_47841 [Smallanthus sonchifolius]|uniref:Uncharacterized protein n=1 Tax=Smallanthus sonchifolius TaxID=185202 RepID=A0ACB9FQS5_9ASTR|nr:hypothetical protein L1987_47841 [Smallanthus sonchifolius]